MLLAGLGQLGLELIAQGQQFIDFGDDAVLFGEGRQWHGDAADLANAQIT